MPKLAGHPVAPTIELPVDHQSSAHAGANNGAKDSRELTGLLGMRLRQREAAAVIVQGHRAVESVRQIVHHLPSGQTGDVRRQQLSGMSVHQSRHANADFALHSRSPVGGIDERGKGREKEFVILNRRGYALAPANLHFLIKGDNFSFCAANINTVKHATSPRISQCNQTVFLASALCGKDH